MKTLFILLVCVILFASHAKANPIDNYAFEITELYFDENNDWHLELSFAYIAHDEYTSIDSLVISTNTEQASMLFLFSCEEYNCVFEITEDMLNANLALNKEGEAIKITVYYSMAEVDEIISRDSYFNYGNVQESYIRDFQSHQSIVKINLPTMEGSRYKYARDNTPNLGQLNDTNGVCGYFYGKVYDLKNNIIPNHEFMLDFEFSTNGHGEYKTSICSRNYINKVIYKDVWMIGNSNIKAFDGNIEPYEHYNFDIYLLDDNLVGLIEHVSGEKFQVFPNPANSHINIKGELSEKAEIVISNVLGQTMCSQSIEFDTKNYYLDLDEKLKEGIYTLSIIENNNLTYSKQIIINRFK